MSYNFPLLGSKFAAGLDNGLGSSVVDFYAIGNGLESLGVTDITGCSLSAMNHKRAIGANDPFLGTQKPNCGGTRNIAIVVGNNLYWQPAEKIKQENSVVNIPTWRLNYEMDCGYFIRNGIDE